MGVGLDTIWKVYKTAYATARRSVYLAQMRVWRAGAVILGLSGVGTLIELPWEIGAILLAGSTITAGAWLRWAQVRRWRGKPKILIASFGSENAPYDEIAHVHVRALERRLVRNDFLCEMATVQIERAPISMSDAKRIMAHAPVLAVVSGSGLAVAGHARWEGWLRVGWFSTVGRYKKADSDLTAHVRDAEPRLQAQVVDLPIDGRVDLADVTKEIFDAAHARAAEIVLMLAFGALYRRLGEAAALIDDEPESLPNAIAVRLIVGRAAHLEMTADSRAAAGFLERAGEQYDAVGIWEAAQSAFLRTATSTPDPARQTEAQGGLLRTARRGVSADAGSLMSRSNVALSLLSRGERSQSRSHFYAALAIAQPDEPGNIYPDLLVNAYRAGGAEHWTAWQSHFAQTLPIDRPGVVHLTAPEPQLAAEEAPDTFGTDDGADPPGRHGERARV